MVTWTASMKAAGLTFLSACCVFAQTHQHAPPPGQPWVDLAKLPEPQRIVGLGHSHIGITTKSPEAQQWFDQGLAAFHCFWDYEALRARTDRISYPRPHAGS